MKQELAITTVENVRGYVDEKGTVMLNAEDVARGLGFTRTAASGNEVVRWERMNNYLQEFGHPQKVGTKDFIPENMFYRLAMKASNATAQAFQAKVADVILPAIRKHGVYATNDFLSKSIADPLWAIGILTALKNEQDKTALLETQLAEAKPKADYCDWILQCTNLVTTSVIAKDYGMSAKKFNQLLHDLGVQFRQGEMWLLYQKYAAQGWSQTKTHKYVDANGKIHCKVHTYWTQKGRLGLYDLLKKKNYFPTIEKEAVA